MTANPSRRRRRTILAAVASLVLIAGAAALFVVGVITLSNSEEGEAVGIDERPVVALPETPNAVLAVADDNGQLASVVVMTLVPEGQGGSIVTIPVNADSTSGFGSQRRPLSEVFDAADPASIADPLEEMLTIAIQRVQIVDVDELDEMLEPLESLEVVLPDDVIASDSIGSGIVALAGPQTLRRSLVAESLAAVDDGATAVDETDGESDDDSTSDDASDGDSFGEQADSDSGDDDSGETSSDETGDGEFSAYDRHDIDVEIWSQLAQTAPVAVPADQVEVDEFGRPVPPETVGDLMDRLWEGEIAVRDLAVSTPPAANNPTDADVVIIDRTDDVLVFAQISPALMSTPNPGMVLRLEVPFSEAQIRESDGRWESPSELTRALIGQLLFLSANVVSVDTAAGDVERVTRIEVADERFIPDLEELAPSLFGETEVVVATTLLEGVDATVRLGSDFLATDADVAAGSADDAAADDTVAGDVDASDTAPEDTDTSGTVGADG